MAERQELSKTYGQRGTGTRIPAAVLGWVLGLALTANAQEPSYSANSLTATFDSGSRVSLKGTEIFLRDVVAEIRISKVIFKNSLNDNVICELGPTVQRDKQAAVGSELRVKGRVRGRGLLGNVTLDDCHVMPIEVSTATVSTEPQEPASAETDVIPVIEETPPTETLPVEAPPAISVPDPPRSIPTQPATRPSAPRATLVPDLTPTPDPVEPTPSVPTVRDYPESSINPGSDSPRPVSYGFYALLVLSGAVAPFILSKLLSSATRVLRRSARENTPEMRQAALQALLLKAEKKK